jgi:Trypsin
LFGGTDAANATGAYDFMLSKLSGKSTMKPIRLNHDSNVPTSKARLVAMGWGVESEFDSNTIPDELRHVNLTYITNSQCVNKTMSGTDDLGTYEGMIFDTYVSNNYSRNRACIRDTHLKSL